MNQVNLTGRITKDIELRRTQNGKAVTSFFLAVNKRNREEGADFISCVAWGGTAEAMNRFLKKGSKIAVSGRLSVRTYEKGNQKHYVTEVVVDEAEFLESRKSEAEPPEFTQIEDDGEDDGDLPF